MGFTHFDKVVGVNGLFTGAKGSEIGVPVTESVSVALYPVTTGALTAYVVAPIAGTISGYAAFSVSAVLHIQ